MSPYFVFFVYSNIYRFLSGKIVLIIHKLFLADCFPDNSSWCWKEKVCLEVKYNANNARGWSGNRYIRTGLFLCTKPMSHHVALKYHRILTTNG